MKHNNKTRNIARAFLFSLFSLGLVGCASNPTLSGNALVHDDLSALPERRNALHSSLSGRINFYSSQYQALAVSGQYFDSSFSFSGTMSGAGTWNSEITRFYAENYYSTSGFWRFHLMTPSYQYTGQKIEISSSEWSWSFYDGDGNEVTASASGYSWDIPSQTLSYATFTTTDFDWYELAYSAVYSYNQGYSSGSSEGYSTGYSEGYSSGYYTGSSEAYSSGYEAGHEYASTSWVVGRSVYALSVPQYSTFTGYQAWSHMYTGAPLGYTSKKVEFNNGSYVEFFKEAYSLNESHTALGYRFVSSSGTSTPLYYVVYDGNSTYSKFVYGYDSDSGNVTGYFPLVNSSDGVVSLKIVALDDGEFTELNESYLIPYYDDGYLAGYADGQTAPTNLPDNYAEGYAQGLADGNDGWNTIIPTIFASVGAFFYPWTTIEIFGISILGIFGALTFIGIVALVIKVFLK